MKEKLKELSKRLSSIKSKKKYDDLVYEHKDLEAQSLSPDFWKDSEKAQDTMRTLNQVAEEINLLDKLETKIANTHDVVEMAANEGDSSIEDDLAGQIEGLSKQLDALELETYLSGKFDKNDAILSIHAGQGGTEACDWAEILKRMYTRYFEGKGWEYTITNEVKGTEAGISSVSIEVRGNYAFGYLKREHGTHRLVRNSPFNSQGLRQTSFAGVEVGPLITENIDIEIKDEDIDFSAVRSSGPGGQNVNKVSTAVRIIHKPTGITVSSSAGRSQLQNKKAALNQLKSKLFLIEEEKREAEKNKATGTHTVAGWGNQIRNYILQPYKLVKDLRTKVESTNPDEILDGNLERFIEAEIEL